ncbi:MAG: hypothetical protein CYG60_19850 [Actinobacteria bacterium]|nr:MAG: hypothetical protein CYG60_19850 [Actinomycetota bacterium]
MTQENTTPETATTEANAVHHQTKKSADLALAKKAISPDSHRAVLAGDLSLEEARSLGRNAGPAGPAVRVNKNDRTPTSTPCLCGCGELVPRNFKAGHDMRMYRVAREHLTEGRELTDEQADYLETSGKMARVKAKIAEENRRRAEQEAKKKPKK